MRTLPNVLIVLAAIGILAGFVIRLSESAARVTLQGRMPAFADPVFYWRGAMAFLAFAIAIVVIQIRDKSGDK